MIIERILIKNNDDLTFYELNIFILQHNKLKT